MKFNYGSNNNRSNEERLKELDEDHELEIEKKTGSGKIPDYQQQRSENGGGNGKADKNNKKQQQPQQQQQIQILFTEWSIKLIEKYTNLQKEILDLIPELWEPTEFALSVRTILRIKNITLPFAGIVLGPSGGLKTATVELYRYTRDACYRDSFLVQNLSYHIILQFQKRN